MKVVVEIASQKLVRRIRRHGHRQPGQAQLVAIFPGSTGNLMRGEMVERLFQYPVAQGIDAVLSVHHGVTQQECRGIPGSRQARRARIAQFLL